MISVSQLSQAITLRIEQYLTQTVKKQAIAQSSCALADCQGRILAQSVTASFAVPRFNVSAMDGIAIAKGSALAKHSQIHIVGEAKAGETLEQTLQPNQGVRIFTGAIVPAGCDTVVMQENTDLATKPPKQQTDERTSHTVTLTQPATEGSNIRYQGEEIAAGETVLAQGKRLTPADISLLANLGIDQVAVYPKLKVGVLASGDELVALGQPLQTDAQIYNSNTPTLHGLLAGLPVDIVDYGIVADEYAITEQVVREASRACDVLISTAGVSVGDYDHLTRVIDTLGQINHYKVAMKPGKPFVFGELTPDQGQSDRNSVLFFGLPGNPLSTLVGALVFVLPALWQLAGASSTQIPKPPMFKAKLTKDVKKSTGRLDFQRGIWQANVQGENEVTVFSTQQSHRIKQLSEANCLLVLPEDSSNERAGDWVNVWPFYWTCR